eukprot:m.4481 g.4481  ORF g.4481 m.4481 type:complete len:165 (+) comp2999_c0_seq1:757-1251(+)
MTTTTAVAKSLADIGECGTQTGKRDCVVTTSSEGITHVIHISIPLYHPRRQQESKNTLERVVHACIAKAEELHLSSIAFPVKLGYPPQMTADVLIDIDNNTLSSSSSSSLKTISIVCQHEEDVLKCLEEAVAKKSQFNADNIKVESLYETFMIEGFSPRSSIVL